MTTENIKSYLNDPKFQTAMEYIQNGEWEAGLAGLKDVQKEYPNAKELDALLSEILLKSRFEDDEVADIKRSRLTNSLKIGLRLVMAVIVIGFIYWGVSSIDTWIVDQWKNITQGLVSDFRSVETAIKFRDAQSYLQGDYPEAAVEILKEISETDPDFEGLDDLIIEAEQGVKLKSEYNDAVLLLDGGDTLGALAAFEAIYDVHPHYLDVAIQIQEIQGDFYLTDQLAQAETAYENEDWELASSEYETLRAIAPEFRDELVEQRLIRSYMNIAAEILEGEMESPEALLLADTYFRKALVLHPRDEELLVEKTQVTEKFKERLFQHYFQAAKDAVLGQEDSLVALETANTYLSNALILKPNDPAVLHEFNAANAYLRAQIDFAQGYIHQAISNLELLYSIDPGYAGGTALQTLYESYLARGDIRSATGELEAAMEDYQKAAEIALQTGNPVLKLYFAKVKIAEVQGILNNYAISVNNYREAVELVNLLPLVEAQDPNRAFLLKEAERYTEIEWYRTAYRLYRRVLPASDLLLDTEEIIIIKEGDYLSSLANLYNTTVQEILNANAIPNAGNIQLGQEIVIPILKESD
jgi:tetratricopeptide (TPR) repeat protein